MKLMHKKAISTKGMTAVDQSIFPFRDSVWGFCLFICVPHIQFYKIICDIEHYSIVMEEMQGEIAEDPYGSRNAEKKAAAVAAGMVFPWAVR